MGSSLALNRGLLLKCEVCMGMCVCEHVYACVISLTLGVREVVVPSLYLRNDFSDPEQRSPTSVSFFLHPIVLDGNFRNAGYHRKIWVNKSFNCLIFKFGKILALTLS